MRISVPKRKPYYRVRILLATFSFILMLSPIVRGEAVQNNPLLGKDPLKEILVIEDHNKALAHWAEKGIKDAILINFDTHDDIKRITSEEIEKLRVLMQKKDWNDLRKAAEPSINQIITTSNFIFIAAKLGLIKEVYWINPFEHFAYPDAENRLKVMLQMNGFQKDEISAFTMEKGCLRGKTDGIPLNICNLGSLPQLDLPVILSTNVNYFPTLAREFELDKIIGSLKLTYDALFQMKYKILDAVVSYSVNGGHTSPLHRWVGDLAVEILKKPEIILNNNDPPEYYTILQTAESLRDQKKPKDTLKHLLPLLEKQKYNPQFLMYVAEG